MNRGRTSQAASPLPQSDADSPSPSYLETAYSELESRMREESLQPDPIDPADLEFERELIEERLKIAEDPYYEGAITVEKAPVRVEAADESVWGQIDSLESLADVITNRLENIQHESIRAHGKWEAPVQAEAASYEESGFLREVAAYVDTTLTSMSPRESPMRGARESMEHLSQMIGRYVTPPRSGSRGSASRVGAFSSRMAASMGDSPPRVTILDEAGEGSFGHGEITGILNPVMDASPSPEAE